MDPNLFHIDWPQLLEVLAAVVVLAFVVERVLSLIFEHRLYVDHLEAKGFKELIAFVVSLLVCIYWDFDIISVVLTSETTSIIGQIITAGVIAGGSKASMKLFHDVMKIKSIALAAKKPKPANQ